MNKLLKKLSQQKIGDAHKELARAHLIIALLSVSCIVLLLQGALAPVALDPGLSAVSAVMLGLVALTSLGISITLSVSRKK